MSFHSTLRKPFIWMNIEHEWKFTKWILSPFLRIVSLLTTQIDFSISWLNYNHSNEELFYSTWFWYARNFSFHLALEHDSRMHIAYHFVNREREKHFRNRWQGIWRHSHLWFIKWLKCFMYGISKKKKNHDTMHCNWSLSYQTMHLNMNFQFSECIVQCICIHKNNVCRVQECVR